MQPINAEHCDVYVGRRLTVRQARVGLNYTAEYDNVYARQSDLAPTIMRVASERFTVIVNGQPYAVIVAGQRAKHKHAPARLVKRDNRTALHLTKRYIHLTGATSQGM